MMNPVSNTDLLKALDDLILQESPPELSEIDITVSRVKERAKCGDKKAETMIKKWVADGAMEYIGKRRGQRGHKIDAWRLVTKGKE